MEGNYPRFTPEMKKTHKILIPNMAPVQFRILAAAMEHQGYQVELLENCGSQVAELGLKYVHNDTCYPALLVIGQFLDALNSGEYDLDHTALIITQTGGGCRASNYIFLLRKALEKAGYGNIPVLSLNFSGLEKDSSLQLTLPMIRMLSPPSTTATFWCPSGPRPPPTSWRRARRTPCRRNGSPASARRSARGRATTAGRSAARWTRWPGTSPPSR